MSRGWLVVLCPTVLLYIVVVIGTTVKSISTRIRAARNDRPSGGQGGGKRGARVRNNNSPTSGSRFGRVEVSDNSSSSSSSQQQQQPRVVRYGSSHDDGLGVMYINVYTRKKERVRVFYERKKITFPRVSVVFIRVAARHTPTRVNIVQTTRKSRGNKSVALYIRIITSERPSATPTP